MDCKSLWLTIPHLFSHPRFLLCISLLYCLQKNSCVCSVCSKIQYNWFHDNIRPHHWCSNGTGIGQLKCQCSLALPAYLCLHGVNWLNGFREEMTALEPIKSFRDLSGWSPVHSLYLTDHQPRVGELQHSNMHQVCFYHQNPQHILGHPRQRIQNSRPKHHHSNASPFPHPNISKFQIWEVSI